jgi:small-conductance mechanosensitive channel
MKEIIQNISKNPLLYLLFKLACTAIITSASYFILGKLMNILEKLTREKTRFEMDEEIIVYLRKPLLRLLLIIGAFYFFDNLSKTIGAGYEKYLNGIFYVLIVGQITLILMDLVGTISKGYSKKFLDRRSYREKEEFLPLMVRVIKIFLFAIALIIVLKHFNQDVQSLVVSLGVGSLAIALAAQETLANMISGFVIMTDRPFRFGDRIQLASGEQGDVYEIGLRSTKILTFDNTLIIVPNAQIVKEKVQNLTYPDSVIRVAIKLGVAYGSDVQKVKALLEDICRANPKVLPEPVPNAYLLNFGEYNLEFLITCRVGDWREQWIVAEQIRLEILRRFKEEGIEIPYPQSVIWMKKPPEIFEETKNTNFPSISK